MAIGSVNYLLSMLGSKRKAKVKGKLAERKRSKVISQLRHEALEPRLLMTTAPAGDQFAVAEVYGFENTPSAIAVNSSGAYMVAWESYEEDCSQISGQYNGRWRTISTYDCHGCFRECSDRLAKPGTR